ncbi:MAG: hypothetical protein ABIV21_01895, partial [Pyrinomonadaceae bacterium]
MKQCPVCSTTYTDQTLRYCLADGALLTNDLSNDPTIVSHDTVRIDVPRTFDPAAAPPSTGKPPPSGGGSSSILLKVVLIVAAFGLLGIIVIAAAAGFLYFNRGGTEPSVTVKNGAV